MHGGTYRDDETDRTGGGIRTADHGAHPHARLFQTAPHPRYFPALPALAVLYTVLAKVWGLPYESEIPATINAIAVFIGSLIGISHYNIKKEDKE